MDYHNQTFLTNWYRKTEQVINLYDKARVTVQALERIFPYIPQTQKRLLMNVYLV